MRPDADPRLTAIGILAFLSGLELAWLISPDLPAAETAALWAANQGHAALNRDQQVMQAPGTSFLRASPWWQWTG